MNLEKQIKIAITRVREIFPFDDYINISHYYEMSSILKELKKFLPEFSGNRLLDIGSGPMDKTGIFKILGF